MADITITATSVVPGATAKTVQGVAGETIAQGKAVYKTAAGLWMLADADSATAAAKDVTGVSLTSSALNQPIVVAKEGEVTIGGTLVAGDPYFLSSTPGGIAPYADLSAAEKVVQIGVAKSASVLDIDIQNTGVTK